ncbi:MAG: 6,7-dimethyl-8-ribityllumazine synthase [Nitrospinae bacterium]|nr:6,7-dimethyl-8-ribityllumazine synthase [Nitrospinota bacterium]
METKEGHLKARGNRFGIVVSNFNEFVTSRLLASAIETLKKEGAEEEDIEVVRVPGAFEIPLIARHLARSRRFDAVICLGAVIRGETPHFDYISAEASRGIAQAGWDSGIPTVFGVLTTDTVEQALERAGSSEKNRGAEAARTAIEMATLMKKLHESTRNPTGFHSPPQSEKSPRP